MRKKVKTILITIVVLLLNNATGGLYAQGNWNSNEQNQFKANIILFLKSCDNNFADVKGKLIHSNKDGSKEFEATKGLGKFETDIIQMPDSSCWLGARLKLTDDDEDDMDTLKDLLNKTPGYKIYDSDDDSAVEVPNDADRELIVKSDNSLTVISVISYNDSESYIKIVIKKQGK